MILGMEQVITISFIINLMLIVLVWRIHKHTDRMSKQMEQVWEYLWDDIQNKKDMGKM